MARKRGRERICLNRSANLSLCCSGSTSIQLTSVHGFSAAISALPLLHVLALLNDHSLGLECMALLPC